MSIKQREQQYFLAQRVGLAAQFLRKKLGCAVSLPGEFYWLELTWLWIPNLNVTLVLSLGSELRKELLKIECSKNY
ncbi:MAG: hypothetical protein V4732_17055 [Pseudomonadota bacterium]